MSSENPYAFPALTGEDEWNGMTLRDWFAGQALAGIIRMCGGDTRAREIGHHAYFAEAAYSLADAMLAERAKGGAK